VGARRVAIREADDQQLMKISREGLLSLSLEEMKVLQDHYRSLGRDPTDAELETFAQTWSEHCVHKTFTGDIETEEGLISNMLKTTVARVTRELDPEWCFSVFVDNAGIVDFEGDTAVAFKVETHNHPSALEPFGGAATGVGGVIRDILGVWGEPIANTNVLCFGPLDMPYEKVPKGPSIPTLSTSTWWPASGPTATTWAYPRSTGPSTSMRGMSPTPWSTAGLWGWYPRADT
jgi:phosphoribosylformylglycinamidine synthase